MTDDELREWIEAEHQLSELEKTPEWQTLLEVVRGRVDSLQGELLGGRLTSVERYKFLTGRLAGIKEVLNIKSEVSRLIEGERSRRKEADAA